MVNSDYFVNVHQTLQLHLHFYRIAASILSSLPADLWYEINRNLLKEKKGNSSVFELGAFPTGTRQLCTHHLSQRDFGRR